MEPIPNDISVTEYMLRRLRGKEHKVGLIEGDTGEEWTYGQFKTNILNIGSAFARKGLKKGDIVAIIAPNSLESMAVTFAIPAIGGIMSGMNPLYTSEEILRHVQDCSASYIICCVEVLSKVVPLKSKCPQLKEIIVIGNVQGYSSVSEMRRDDGSCFPNVKFDAANDVAYLPYSSGTTGLPKGVMLTHKGAIYALHLNTDFKDNEVLERERRVLNVFPLYHIGGLGYCGIAIVQCCMIVISRTFNFEAFLQHIEKYKIDLLMVPSPVVVRLTEDKLVDKYNISSMTSIIGGAAPITAKAERIIAQRFGVHSIRRVYGMTEVFGSTHLGGKTNAPGYVCHPRVDCKIIDIESGKELLQPGQRGEIWVRTPTMMKGYWKNPEKTRETLDNDGWLHTGDLGYKDQSDNLHIVDRLKELIKYKGFQVAPAELEALLISRPDIADVAVIGIPDERAGELPAAYVVLKEGRKKDPEGIAKFVAEHAAPYKHLRGGVYFGSSIPKTARGKVQRVFLREQMVKKLKTKSKL